MITEQITVQCYYPSQAEKEIERLSIFGWEEVTRGKSEGSQGLWLVVLKKRGEIKIIRYLD